MHPLRAALSHFLQKAARRLDPDVGERDHPYWHMLTHASEDALFNATYEAGVRAVGFRRSLWRRDRWYNLQAAVHLIAHLPGDIAECGTWKGLSALLVCTRLKTIDPDFRGQGVTLIDSFEGWSAPTSADIAVPEQHLSKNIPTVQDVRTTLKDFPEAAVVKGWIPDVFGMLPPRTYRFVHVDVNMADPTRAAFDYFYERLVPGGVIICDDYGSRHWRGTTAAIDDFCAKNRAPFFQLSSGQILVQKPLQV